AWLANPDAGCHLALKPAYGKRARPQRTNCPLLRLGRPLVGQRFPERSRDAGTLFALKPQSSATMSLAGRWMRRVRFGLLCRSLYRDQYASQIVPSLPADPMLGEPAADPEEKRGPASDKNWSC